MKNLKLLSILAICVTSLGCSVLPVKVGVKENNFRFENFKRVNGSDSEYVHLMCHQKKPTSWAQPKQYLSGEHDLWVKASTSNRHIPNSTREAFVNFKVKLEPNKNYMLNRKVVDDKISIWIQEVDTGLGVSEVLVTQLRQPLLIERNLRKTQCESGSI
ncbi:hypothetical protein [Thalassotalea sp. G2M2-11]|uniref:hypothetical protein n=1 Tax=Thalassotalea sp. G2M2-11 TaxID=2787627 RepID=UPI0019CFE4A9|nr:hypothetical protein [Thalassotalea sp. G2M2-11]